MLRRETANLKASYGERAPSRDFIRVAEILLPGLTRR